MMSGWVGNSAVHRYDETYWEMADAEDDLMSEDSDWTFEEPDTTDIPDWEDSDGAVWRKEGDRWCTFAEPGNLASEPLWRYIPKENRRLYEWWELRDYGFLPFKPADNH